LLLEAAELEAAELDEVAAAELEEEVLFVAPHAVNSVSAIKTANTSAVIFFMGFLPFKNRIVSCRQ